MTGQRVSSRNEVPFLHEKQIERDADLLLQEFGEKFGEVKKPPIPVDDIVELYLQLLLEFKDMKTLFPFADVHGAIWFEQGTIGIDKSLDPHTNPNLLGRYHFTLAHEVGHWRLHRPYYFKNPAERLLFDDGSPRPDVICRSSKRKQPVEWQADAFAAALLMPRKLIYDAWSEFREGDDRPIEIAEIHAAIGGSDLFYRGRLAVKEEEKAIAAKEAYCLPLAALFEVSREAMRIRLETLNLLVRQREATLF